MTPALAHDSGPRRTAPRAGAWRRAPAHDSAPRKHRQNRHFGQDL